MLIKSGRDIFKTIGVQKIVREKTMTHFYLHLLHPYTGIKQEGVLIISYGSINSFMRGGYEVQRHFTEGLINYLEYYLESSNIGDDDESSDIYLNNIIARYNVLIADEQKRNRCLVTAVEWQFDTNKKRIKEGIKLLKTWRVGHGGKKE